MKRIVSSVLICSVFIAAPALMHADDDDNEFRARLSGKEEVPPVTTKTRGKASVEFNDDETEAEFALEIRRGVRVTQAHFHCAPRGSNGPVVAFLAGNHSRGWDINGDWIEDTTLTDDNVFLIDDPRCPNLIDNLRDLAQAMRDGNIYVNVHTVANPAGEVRGQLRSHGDDDSSD